jgi:hypothetical protein
MLELGVTFPPMQEISMPPKSRELDGAVESNGWLRPAAWRAKYSVGPTKFHELKNAGRLEIRYVDAPRFYFVRDRLPAPAISDAGDC